MTSALAIYEPNNQRKLSDAARQRIRDVYFPDVPDDVMETIYFWAEGYSLNPIHIKALHFKVKDKKSGQTKDVYVPYVNRDGVLDHAHRTGLLEGVQVRHGYETATGDYYVEVLVYRKDCRVPTTRTYFLSECRPKARWENDERCAFWDKSPRDMLQKTGVRRAVLEDFPLSLPVVDEDSSYFDLVMSARSGVVEIPGEITEDLLPTSKKDETLSIAPNQLLDFVNAPTEQKAVVENQPPSASVDDPAALDTKRADVELLGEDVFGAAKWKAVKLGLIRGIKSEAASIDDLSLEELTKLTQTLVAKKLGASGSRRM